MMKRIGGPSLLSLAPISSARESPTSHTVSFACAHLRRRVCRRGTCPAFGSDLPRLAQRSQGYNFMGCTSIKNVLRARGRKHVPNSSASGAMDKRIRSGLAPGVGLNPTDQIKPTCGSTPAPAHGEVCIVTQRARDSYQLSTRRRGMLIEKLHMERIA